MERQWRVFPGQRHITASVDIRQNWVFEEYYLYVEEADKAA